MSKLIFNKLYLERLSQFFLLEFKLKYNQTFLGFFWSILKPLALILTLLAVFSFFPSNIENFVVYLIIGVITWTFFSNTTVKLLNSLSSKKDFIKKINFDKKILLQSSLLSELVSYLILLAITIIIMPLLNVIPHLTLKILIPILNLTLLLYGIGLILSVLFIYFKDLSYITELFIQIGFFLTPIFYEINLIPEQFRGYYLLNPVTRSLESLRNVLFEGNLLNFGFEILTFSISIFFILIGLYLFNKLEKNVADEL